MDHLSFLLCFVVKDISIWYGRFVVENALLNLDLVLAQFLSCPNLRLTSGPY